MIRHDGRSVPKLYLDEYLKDLDPQAAYRRAGYSARTSRAGWTGSCLLLRNPKVRALIEQKRTAIERRTDISQDRVRVELGQIAVFDPRRLFDPETGQLIEVSKLPPEVAAVISSVKVTQAYGKDTTYVTTEVKWACKIAALDQLCRYMGMYENKVRTHGLDRELAALSDEEIERRLIELGKYRRIGASERERPAGKSFAKL